MLKVSNISKRLGDFHLTDISLGVEQGDYYVLMGRSGSGKTQLLELLAGLTLPDAGTVTMKGREITWMKPQKRNIGFVFQDFAVFPHMSTFDNIAYPLRIRKMPADEINRRVHDIARKMNIEPILNRSTTNLSGGELQRTAIARTLVTSPDLLLLDEPLASIDASLKDDITRLLRSINRSGQTIIHVTHDYSEAIGLASKVGVIHEGRLIQSGTPQEVFGHPINRFVARYTGIRNFFRVKFVTENGKVFGKTEGGLTLALNGGNYPDDGLLIIRSNNVRLLLDSHRESVQNQFAGKIVELVATPSGYDVEIDAGDRIYASVAGGDRLLSELREGTTVTFGMAPDDLVWLKGTR
jgi:molybdate/tungstate transport system ATP-binding protein